MDLSQLQEAMLRKSRLVKSNVVRVMGDRSSGFKFNIPGLGMFDRILDAFDAADTLGHRTSSDFRAGMSLAQRPSSGPLYYDFIEKFAQALGPAYTVRRESYGLTPASSQFLLESLDRGGLAVPDNDLATVLRVLRGDTELSTQDVEGALRDAMGLRMTPGGNLAKRLKALFSVRDIGMTQMASEFQTGKAVFKVGVFDPNKNLAALNLLEAVGKDTNAEIATEGMSIINPRTVREVADYMEARAAGMISSVAADSMSQDAIHARTVAKQLRDEASRLRGEAATGGGMFNMRMMGLDIRDIGGVDQATIDQLNDLQAQIKGNVIIGTKGAFKGMNDVDVLTAVQNLKAEAGLVGQKARVLTLDRHIYDRPVFTNVQALSHLPEAFDRDELRQYTYQEMQARINRVRSGDLGQYMRDLEEILDTTDIPDDSIARESLQRAQAHARSIQEFIANGGDINEDPALLKQFYKSYESFLTRRKGGSLLPRLLVPDAMRENIVSEAYSDRAWRRVNQFGDEGRIGQRTIDGNVESWVGWDQKSRSWILSNEDIVKHFKAFGGFDLDDVLVQMLRWDETANNGAGALRMIAYRDPGALGEHGVFNIHVHDMAVAELFKKRMKLAERTGNDAMRIEAEAGHAEVLRLRGMLGANQRLRKIANSSKAGAERVEDAKNQLADLTNLISESRDKINGHASRVFEHVKDTDRLAARSIANGYAHPALELNTTLEQAITDAGKKTFNTFDEYARDKIRSAAMSSHELGAYSNTRMVIDSLLSENAEDAFAAHSFSYVHQETAIDAVIQMLTEKGTGTSLSDLTAKMQHQIGYHVAAAVHAGKIQGVDAYMLQSRILYEGVGQVKAGIKQFNEEKRILGTEHELTWENIQLQKGEGRVSPYRDDTAAIIGNIHSEALDEVRNATYAKSIMEPVVAYTPEERAAAEDIFATYYDSLKQNVTGFSGLGDEAIEEQINTFGRVLEDADGWDQVAKDTLQTMMQHVEESGEVGPKLYRIMAAAQSMAAERHYGHHALAQVGKRVSISDIKLASHAYMTQQAINAGAVSMGDQTYGVLINTQHTLLRRIDRKDMMDEIESVNPEVTELLKNQDIARKMATRMRQAKDKLLETGLPRIFSSDGMKTVRRLWDSNPSLRVGALGLGALVIGSEIYQRTKDRSNDNMEGPPLLPGGSSYEDYGISQMPESYQYVPPQQTGVTYKINTRGNYNPNQLASAAETIAGAPSSGTIYSTPSGRHDNVLDVLAQEFG